MWIVLLTIIVVLGIGFVLLSHSKWWMGDDDMCVTHICVLCDKKPSIKYNLCKDCLGRSK